MIRIHFDPADLTDEAAKTWWEEWGRRAEIATTRAIRTFEEWLEGEAPRPSLSLTFRPKIWKELRDWFLKHVFYHKCAYCEREISGFPGDGEHYRPKGAVKHRNADGKVASSTCSIPDPVHRRGKITQSRPGYFWLAYEWRNLLPACTFCNSGRGKNDLFNIQGTHVILVQLSPAEVDALPPLTRYRPSRWPGYYYPTPAMLDTLENPLLLNPLNSSAERDPAQHLRFGVRGIITALDDSSFGTTSIEVFRLKDEELRIKRQKAQETFQMMYYDAMQSIDPDKPGESKVASLLREYRAGQYPFSAAALAYREHLRKLEDEL